MDTIPSPSVCRLVGLFAVLTVSGCMENEGQVQELRQLREKLTAAQKQLAEQTQPSTQTTATPQDLAESAQKLSQAEGRIAELENELREQKSNPLPPTTPAMAVGTADSLGLLVEAMENDLLNKVGELRSSLGKAVPAANLLDTTIKRLRPLDKIASAYDSAITFKVSDKHGNTRKLVFPVQPGTDGRWHLPSIAIIQQQINVFINRDWPQPGLASHGGSHLTTPLPLPPGHGGKTSNGKSSSSEPDSYIIRWDHPPSHDSKPQSAPVAAVSTPPPPAIAAPPATRVVQPVTHSQSRKPALIMPVMQDVQVRFE